MSKLVHIEVKDSVIRSIGVKDDWIIFHTDDGDQITLEKHSLERGLACHSASNKPIPGTIVVDSLDA